MTDEEIKLWVKAHVCDGADTDEDFVKAYNATKQMVNSVKATTREAVAVWMDKNAEAAKTDWAKDFWTIASESLRGRKIKRALPTGPGRPH